MARFVIGRSEDAAREAALTVEEATHRDFERLPLTEGYAGLPTKTLLFLRVGRLAPCAAACSSEPWVPRTLVPA